MSFKDKIIIFFSLIVFIGASAFLMYHDASSEDQIDRQIIGEVANKSNLLRRKSATSLAWKQIDEADLLFDGDKVFTTKGSKAILKIQNSSTIQMGELTLLKLDSPYQSKINIDFLEGMFVADLDLKDGINEVRSKESVFKLSSDKAKLQFNVTEDK